MLKEFPWDKINVKKALFFLSLVPTYYSFIFNLQFLYELNHKVQLSTIVCGIFNYRFRLVFIKVRIVV